jgi:hypothetical protein
MGLSRSAAPPGIPQKIWESSSALRSLCESAETDGHDLLRILDDLNTFGRIRQQHRTALLQERHRLGDMLESVANIATEEIASGMSPSDPQHPNASTAASAAASEAFAGSEPEPEIQPEPEADEDSELAAALELSMQADTAGTTAEAEASTLIDTARSPVQPDGRLLRDAAGVLTCSQIIRDDAGPHSGSGDPIDGLVQMLLREFICKFIAPGLEDMLLSISTTTLQGEDVSNTAQLTQYEQEHDASMRRLSKTFQYIRT